MVLLLQEPHFDNLFTLLEKLSDMSTELQDLVCVLVYVDVVCIFHVIS